MRKTFCVLFFGLLLIISGCGPDYNTDFEPPPQNARVNELFPEEIDGMKVDVKRMTLTQPLEGFSAEYGRNKISIDTILAPSKNIADDHFKEVIVPRFDEMKNHYREKLTVSGVQTAPMNTEGNGLPGLTTVGLLL